MQGEERADGLLGGQRTPEVLAGDGRSHISLQRHHPASDTNGPGKSHEAMRWLEGFEAEEEKQKDAMQKTFFSNKSEYTPCVERSIVHFGVAFDVLQCCFNRVVQQLVARTGFVLFPRRWLAP